MSFRIKTPNAIAISPTTTTKTTPAESNDILSSLFEGKYSSPKGTTVPATKTTPTTGSAGGIAIRSVPSAQSDLL